MEPKPYADWYFQTPNPTLHSTLLRTAAQYDFSVRIHVDFSGTRKLLVVVSTQQQKAPTSDCLFDYHGLITSPTLATSHQSIQINDIDHLFENWKCLRSGEFMRALSFLGHKVGRHMRTPFPVDANHVVSSYFLSDFDTLHITTIRFHCEDIVLFTHSRIGSG